MGLVSSLRTIPKGPHPEEAALLRGRLEVWTQALTRSILRDASLRDAPQDEANVGCPPRRSEATASLEQDYSASSRYSARWRMIFPETGSRYGGSSAMRRQRRPTAHSAG